MHDLSTCLYYHNAKDRRRPHLNYEHVMCESWGDCPNGDSCYYAHNKIEQLYHPSRYKSKFCEKFPDQLAECEYREFCSFAHSNHEIAIELIHEKVQNMDFMVNLYKTVWCPYTNEYASANTATTAKPACTRTTSRTSAGLPTSTTTSPSAVPIGTPKRRSSRRRWAGAVAA